MRRAIFLALALVPALALGQVAGGGSTSGVSKTGAVRPSAATLTWTGNGALNVPGGSSLQLQQAGTPRLQITTGAALQLNSTTIQINQNGSNLDGNGGSIQNLSIGGVAVLTWSNNSFPIVQLGRALAWGANAALPTCNNGIETVMMRQAGGTGTLARTKICMCTSDGAASPAYAWINVHTNAVGTTTTCP